MILACDPGIKGAFALRGGDALLIVDMPTFKQTAGARGAERKFIDEAAVLSLMHYAVFRGAKLFLIEEVGGLPGQAASGAFTFGSGYGAVRMAARAAGLQLEKVKAATWKPRLRVPSDKTAARARATEMMPEHAHYWPLKGHDGRAEAALLSLYAERFL